jgi:integrase/recombinase XerC
MNQNIHLTKFKKYLQDHDFSDLTVQGYLSDLKLFTHWFEQTHQGGGMQLEDITPTDVEHYRQRLLSVDKRTANTVNRKLASLSALTHWALKMGKIASDPMQNIKLVPRVNSVPQWLGKREQTALKQSIARDLQLAKLRFPKRWVTRRRDASLVLFMLNTGLRLSETVSLQMDDVQLGGRKGSVLARSDRDNKRSVPLNSEARQALKDWFEVRPESRYVWTVVEGDSGSGLSGRTVQRLINRYAQEADLDDLTPQVLRNTFTKNLVNAGVGLEKVAALLGHASLNTTRLYVTPGEGTPIEKDLAQAVNTLMRS